jgi:hypothetical protein
MIDRGCLWLPLGGNPTLVVWNRMGILYLFYQLPYRVSFCGQNSCVLLTIRFPTRSIQQNFEDAILVTFVPGEGFLCVPNGKAVGDESRQLFATREKEIACLRQVLVHSGMTTAI